MLIAETDRLRLRDFELTDAPFILQLLNDPGWLRFIGDRNIRTLQDAEGYLLKGPIAMGERNGFSLWAVDRKDDGATIGMCGLVRRDTLPDVDIGFALLPAFRGQGYAQEAAQATLARAREVLKLPRVVAIASLDNEPSRRLLEQIGLRFVGPRALTDDGDELAYYAIDWPPAGE
jgi:RimJ/RimL family protein N-acetyltransferase